MAGAITYLLGLARQIDCTAAVASIGETYTRMCYSDLPMLYERRGLADGTFPYLVHAGDDLRVLEYPALTGIFAYVLGFPTRWLGGNHTTFWLVSAFVMAGLFLWTIASTSRTVPHRPWDGLKVALAPAVFLAAFINWDLLAVALTSAFLLAWSRGRLTWAGIWLGLAISAKFYPIVLVGALLLYCARRVMWRELAVTTLATAVTWATVNIPVMMANFDGWAEFYRFSEARNRDLGSLWYAVELLSGADVRQWPVNELASGTFLVLCIGIGILALRAPKAPRLASLAFLAVAAFAITNKVYSPQFVLWLLPLAVLARPKWRDIILWQVGQAVYFVAVWHYLSGLLDHAGLSPRWYAAAILVHVGSTLWLMAVVVRDVLRPDLDPVRSSEPSGSAHDEVGLDGREADVAVDELPHRGRDRSARDAQERDVHVGGLLEPGVRA